MRVENGMPADDLPTARWRKSSASNPSGSCVEIAELPGGKVALRNSRDASGPALVYLRAEVAAFLACVKGGEFDSLVSLLPRAGTAIWGAHAENGMATSQGCSVYRALCTPPPDAFGPFRVVLLGAPRQVSGRSGLERAEER